MISQKGHTFSNATLSTSKPKIYTMTYRCEVAPL